MKPDIVMVSGLEMTEQERVLPQLGQMILQKILEPRYKVTLVNYDRMVSLGTFRYDPDYDTALEAMAEHLASLGAPVVGFYTICHQFINAVNLASWLHRRDPAVRIFFGGPHATMVWDHCLRTFPWLRAVCMGESEYSIQPLTEALLGDGNLRNVPGIARREEDGTPVLNPPCRLVPEEELHRYTVYEMDQALAPEQTTMNLEGGRGCPFHCSFCSTSRFWHRHFRMKPAEDLIREMDTFHERSGIRRFSIEHDMFTANRKYVETFCRLLTDRGTPYRWACSSRIDVLDEDLIRLMARAGCEEVFLGIETGSPRMQQVIDKHLNLEDAIPKVMVMRQEGILVMASFIYGLPGEEEEDFLLTLKMLRKLYLAGVKTLQLHRFFPLPGTPDGDRVRGSVYFDEFDIDLSIISRRVLTPENREMILRYPDLFLHYYTFPSEVRKKYRWADALTVFTSRLAVHFACTCGMLLERRDYQELYEKYEEAFRRISLAYSTEGVEAVVALLEPMLADMVEREAWPPLAEMFRYEKDLKDFLAKPEKEPLVVSYGMDINRARREKEYVMRPFRAMLAYDAGKNLVRTVELPDWLRL